MNVDPELESWLAADPNTLPYCVTETATGGIVPVRFEPLTENDVAELQGDVWSQSVFRDVWPIYAGDGQTLKLICVGSGDISIQGLVRLGQVAYPGGFLRKSLLESAPSNQQNASLQQYRGVGRVLVARLAAESFRQGAEGRVAVEPRPDVKTFYIRLGFQNVRNDQKVLRLYDAEARTLLRNALMRP